MRLVSNNVLMLLDFSALILWADGQEREEKGVRLPFPEHWLCAGHTARLIQCFLVQFCTSTVINEPLGSERVAFQTKIIEKERMVLYEGWWSHTHVGDKDIKVLKKAMAGKGPERGTLDQCGFASSVAKWRQPPTSCLFFQREPQASMLLRTLPTRHI